MGHALADRVKDVSLQGEPGISFFTLLSACRLSSKHEGVKKRGLFNMSGTKFSF